jgi:hypothetical protein
MRIVYSHQGREESKEFEQAEVVIGRPKEGGVVDLDLTPDRSVSRPHARIWMEKGQYWIKDLGSKRGTFVDGERVEGKVELKPGAEVRVGNTMLWLVVEGEKGRRGEGEKGRRGEGEKRDETPASLKVRVEVKCLPTVNYSLVHADVPFLLEVTLFNEGDAPLMDGRLQLALSGYAESEMVTIPTVPAKGSHMVNPLPKFTFKREKLKDLPTPETVTLEAWVNDERMPLNPPVEVKVLPPNAWHCVGHEKALAGFVMPNSDAVDEIITRARRFLQRLLKKAQGFADALESADPKAVEKTLKAVYFCLQERYDITYEYEPHFDAPDWQMIRFHHKVLDVDELEGTCIDLALLFAACLENVHRQPLIIIVKTGNGVQHAVIGCWRERSLATAAVIRDEAQLRRWVKSGEILVLDSKGFPKTKEFPERMPFAR